MNENKSVVICFISLIMLLMLTRSRQPGLYSVSLSGFGVEFLPWSLIVLLEAAGAEID